MMNGFSAASQRSIAPSARFLWLFLVVIATLTACTDEWDKHYNNPVTEILNEQLTMVDVSSEAYLSDPAQSNLSAMYMFLRDNGVFTTLEEKGQLHTLLMVENADFVAPAADDALFVANSHVTDISLSPSNLYDGERILMWHGKFVTVGIDSLGLMGNLDHITFNGSPAKQVVKTTDGYIYVLDAMIQTPTSLSDYINNLPDDYSTFREMVLASGGKVFDKAGSKPVGVDVTGNTIYDTVWIYTNDFFDARSFSLTSESLTATMLLFSNDVINRALAQADSTLAAWDMERDRDILRRWLLEVAFFSTRYSKADFESAGDLRSIYDRQWRVAEQDVDLDHPIEVSNGIIYNVRRVRIPNNVLMYRLKDFYSTWEFCSDEQKTAWYQFVNIKNIEASTEVAGWTPEAGVWPIHENRCLKCYPDDKTQGFAITLQPFRCIKDASGNVADLHPWLIPPGTYRFAMGFAQNMGYTFDITLSAVNGPDVIDLGKTAITIDSSTKFHYDRGTTLSDAWPEGYTKEERTRLLELNSKANNYDTDGGGVFDEIEIPDLVGDGSALPIQIRIDSHTPSDAKIILSHWCLRPTSNNY